MNTHQAIETLHINPDLVEETIFQLNKDLNSIKKTIDIPVSNFVYVELVDGLCQLLTNTKMSDIQVFLYQVDLSEETLKKLHRKKLPSQQFYVELSKLIIEREFKKVFIKRHYSK